MFKYLQGDWPVGYIEHAKMFLDKNAGDEFKQGKAIRDVYLAAKKYINAHLLTHFVPQNQLPYGRTSAQMLTALRKSLFPLECHRRAKNSARSRAQRIRSSLNDDEFEQQVRDVPSSNVAKV